MQGGEILKREWLIAYRKAKGLTQQDIAEILNVNINTYSFYEQGLRRPSPKNAKRIAQILDFDWTKFYEGE